MGTSTVAGQVKPAPETVQTPEARDLYASANRLRAEIKAIAADVDNMRKVASNYARSSVAVDGEVPANFTLAYRHLEDASQRLGKVLQALDGGVSVYDRATTVGA